MKGRTHTEESLTARSKILVYNKTFAALVFVSVKSPETFSYRPQAHHEAGGPSSVPEGCNMPCSGHCSSFWHCAGCLLSRGRGGGAKFAGIAVLGIGGCGVSVQITRCFNVQ